MRTDAGRTEGRTHVRRAMTKLMVTFLSFAIAQKNVYAGTDIHSESQMKDCPATVVTAPAPPER
jgi:hypothetical protein